MFPPCWACCFQITCPLVSSQKKKTLFLFVRKHVFGDSLAAAGWKGRNVGVLSASWRLWRRDRWSDCSVISLSELADGAGDFCYNLLSCHPWLWAHRNHQQFPHSDPVRTLKCLEKKQEGAGVEFYKLEGCSHLSFACLLYFEFLKKMNF